VTTRARKASGADSDERAQELGFALHDVSNALTVVLGWLDVVKSRLPEGADRQALEVACTHARLGYSVARRAIGAEVTDTGSGQSTAHAAALGAVTGVTPEATRRGVELVLDPSITSHARIGSLGAVLQILTNVLLNAIAFTPKGRRVTLELREHESHVVFRICDEGPGIAPERASSVFNGPVSTRRGGAGLGLRHSHALAAAHSGRLDIAGGSGSGACFELMWPVVEARSATHPQRYAAAGVAGTRTLVIEDDAAVRSLIEISLEPYGVETVLVASGAEFEHALARGDYDFALVDLSPLADRAAEALAHLRAACPRIQIILISGVASGVPAAVEHLVDAWVRKPFEMGEILAVMSRLLLARAPSLESAAG
jgi:CheY-like chemotaxis protein